MLTLDEVKKYLRVDFSDEDTLITSLISTADSLVRDVSRMEHDGGGALYGRVSV